MSTAPRVTLLYDGECDFCAWWVRYWRRLSGARVSYRTYQEALADFPGLSAAECRQAVQLIEADGQRTRAAAACFGVLGYAGQPLWRALYRRSSGFASVSEFCYRHIAARRQAAAGVARALWGRERYPASYERASQLFIKVVGLIFCCAFISLAVQIEGLLGSNGILPAQQFMHAAEGALSDPAWLHLPSLFWLAGSDEVLVGACLLGATAGLLAVLGARPAASLAVCYVLYLSVFSIGQDFMSFQWDLLLLECGFLAIFLNPRTPVITFLFRLLLFRFMFLSGCVKLLSGDPSWATMAALDYHYETQPLPSPLAWYAHLLPAWFDRLCVVGTWVVELALPFLIFAPRQPRMLAAVGFIGLEIIIALTGNYNFFNLLTVALVLFLFDDAQFGRVAGRACTPLAGPHRMLSAALVSFIIMLNVYFLARPFLGAAMPAWANAAVSRIQPLRITNGYGLFAVMTTRRAEIEIQGSLDARNWQAYAFRYKPGDVRAPLRWVIPHQPRLDWQMWFAALSSAERTPWFGNLLVRLLNAEPTVLELLDKNPFARAPPRFVRAVFYDYRFTTPSERTATGAVWHRRQIGLYFPVVKLP